MRFLHIVLLVVCLCAWIYLGTFYTAMARRRRPLTPPQPCSSQPPSDCHPSTDVELSSTTRGSSTSTAGRSATPSTLMLARLRSPSRKRRGSPEGTSLTDSSRGLVPSDCGYPTSAPRSHSGSLPRPSTRSLKPVKIPRTQSTLGRTTVSVFFLRDVVFLSFLAFWLFGFLVFDFGFFIVIIFRLLCLLTLTFSGTMLL